MNHILSIKSLDCCCRELLHIAGIFAMAFFDWASGSVLFFFTQTTPLFRVIIFFMVWAGCWLPLAVPIAIVLNWHPPKPMAAAQKLPLLASLYLIVPLLLLGVAWVEGRSFSSYGLTWNPSVLVSLGIGFSLAVLSLGVVFGTQQLLGWIDWQVSNWKRLGSICLPILLLGLWVGATEELVFRGFLVNELCGGELFRRVPIIAKDICSISTTMLLKPDTKLWLAAAISSLIFALLHLVWEIRETLPQLLGLWLMGMVLVLARACDRGNLGLAWGLHAGWVWCLVSLDAAQLISYTGKASAWMTGLGGKPLAGVAGILCLLGTAATLLILDLGFRIP